MCCEWELNEEGDYETDCGHSFTLNDGTLVENSMKFCCFCGKPTREVLFKENFEDEE